MAEAPPDSKSEPGLASDLAAIHDELRELIRSRRQLDARVSGLLAAVVTSRSRGSPASTPRAQVDVLAHAVSVGAASSLSEARDLIWTRLTAKKWQGLQAALERGDAPWRSVQEAARALGEGLGGEEDWTRIVVAGTTQEVRDRRASLRVRPAPGRAPRKAVMLSRTQDDRFKRVASLVRASDQQLTTAGQVVERLARDWEAGRTADRQTAAGPTSTAADTHSPPERVGTGSHERGALPATILSFAGRRDSADRPDQPAMPNDPSRSRSEAPTPWRPGSAAPFAWLQRVGAVGAETVRRFGFGLGPKPRADGCRCPCTCKAPAIAA